MCIGKQVYVVSWSIINEDHIPGGHDPLIDGSILGVFTEFSAAVAAYEEYCEEQGVDSRKVKDISAPHGCVLCHEEDDEEDDNYMLFEIVKRTLS